MSTKAERQAAATVNDPRWIEIVNRDPAAEGKFFYSVNTTGVYCRPTCAARTARPEHVAFHASAAEAERAGFRPCKRCKPGEPPLNKRHAQLVATVCRLLEIEESPPDLNTLAGRFGISAYHLHRVFKSVTGLTPGAYRSAHRAKRFRAELERSATVTEAIYGAGYGSNGRCYEESNSVLGMTPSAYRAGGKDMPIRFAIGECTLGSILVAASERGICAISLGDDPERLVHDLQDRFPRAHLIGDDHEFQRVVAKVVGYVEAPQRGLDLPLDIRGTAFQQRVWQTLRMIPPGTTVSYTALAKRLGAPGAVRAVAHACAANTLAVAIPCHRVVRNDGALAGYRWGIERKRALIEREAKS